MRTPGLRGMGGTEDVAVWVAQAVVHQLLVGCEGDWDLEIGHK